MGTIETPEQRWGEREKPYHRTGEIDEGQYLSRLTQDEGFCLSRLLTHMQSVASSIGSPIHLLAVGSSTDLNSDYADLDLIAILENTQARSEFAQQIYNCIVNDTSLCAETVRRVHQHLNSSYFPFKLRVHPMPIGVKTRWYKQFDITLFGQEEGSFDDALLFCRQNSLAFATLTSKQTSLKTSL